MLESTPTKEELSNILGPDAFTAWVSICDFVGENYTMDTLWSKGGKGGMYEYKFHRSGKTLCALYVREKKFGFMVIYGQAEREKFESAKLEFSDTIRVIYDEAATYHDGKWIMVEVLDSSFFEELKKMIIIKKKPVK